jgi:hypothetical protein
VNNATETERRRVALRLLVDELRALPGVMDHPLVGAMVLPRVREKIDWKTDDAWAIAARIRDAFAKHVR